MHARLIEKFLTLSEGKNKPLPLLDLACGSGRNGKYLSKRGYPVTFADKNPVVLNELALTLKDNKSKTWQVDFEQPNKPMLPINTFGSILVFRYLHRPLMEQIKGAVVPGGYVVYETFTVKNRVFGRPNNPNFLLELGELASFYSDWDICYQFEGNTYSETSENNQHIAQIIARKPL